MILFLLPIYVFLWSTIAAPFMHTARVNHLITMDGIRRSRHPQPRPFLTVSCWGSGAVSPQKWDCIPSSVFAVSLCIIVYYPLSYPNRDTNCIRRINCIMLSITHVLHVCAKNVKYTRNTTYDTR